jgi:hypothetical protein
VKPLPLVSTVTPAIVAVFTVLPAAAAGLLLPEGEGEEAPAELHATRAATAGNLSCCHDFLSSVSGTGA